jgi:ubiquinone biosynthesis protein
MLWNGIQRLVHILIVLLGHAATRYARSLVERFGWLARRLPPTGLSGPERLRRVFEDLGGSFIKLGQMLAMQPDILPLEYCNALYDLLDHVNPVPADAIARVIREDTGSAPAELFDRFELVPLASGSIGQVHVAWKDGRKLAVKVQRPDARSNFDRDVKLMRLTVWLVRTLRLRVLSFVIDPLSEFAAWTQDELDFRREARYMRQLRRNAAGSDSQYIPFVLDAHTTRRVLVVEFLDGVTLLDHLRAVERQDPAYEARLGAMGFDPDHLARNVIDNCLGDVFRFGVFHADLHPANLMILNGNVIGYIDFGITGVISKYSCQNLLAMTLAYARKDVDRLCDRFFDVSSLDGSSDPLGFRAGVKRLAEHWYTSGAGFGDARLQTTTTQVMLDMVRLSRECRIWPQRDIIKYIRTSIAIDGLIRRFAPGFDFGYYLGTACRRYLTWHARRMLVSHDTLVNNTKASVDLVRDGMFRLAAALEHAAEAPRRGGDVESLVLLGRTSADRPLLLIFITALLLAVGTNHSIRIGPNLVTAELLIAAAAAVRLVAARRVGRIPAGLRQTGG